MQAIQSWFGQSAPDIEPPSSVLAEWNKYSGGSGAQAAQTSLLSSAEEGAAGVTKFVTEAVGVMGARASGAAAAVTTQVQSVQFMPSTQQWTHFAMLLGAGAFMLLLAFFVFLPVLILSPSKFALTFSLGSSLIISSVGALRGWRTLASHIVAKERAPVTAAYAASLLGTLYAALGMHSYVFSIIFCVAQIITLAYYLASYFPGGANGANMVLGSLGRGTFGLAGAVARGVMG